MANREPRRRVKIEKLEDLDVSFVARRGGDFAIAGQKDGVERFRKRDVHRIVCRKCIAEFPNAGQEEIVCVTIDGEVAEILKGFLSSLRGELLLPDGTPQYLSHFKVKKMGSVQRFGSRKDSFVDFDPGRSFEKPFDCGGRIEDDHRESRSRRTASAPDMPATAERWRMRSRNSATVGRSARRRTSASR
jgi:hypothetical protein